MAEGKELRVLGFDRALARNPQKKGYYKAASPSRPFARPAETKHESMNLVPPSHGR